MDQLRCVSLFPHPLLVCSGYINSHSMCDTESIGGIINPHHLPMRHARATNVPRDVSTEPWVLHDDLATPHEIIEGIVHMALNPPRVGHGAPEDQLAHAVANIGSVAK